SPVSRPTPRPRKKATYEPVPPVHPQARRDHAEHAGHRPGRPDRVHLAAGFGVAAGGLSDHPGDDPVSGCQPASDDQCRDRAIGTPVRADARPDANGVHQFGRCIGDHLALQPGHQHGCRRAGSAGRHQRRDQPVTERFARTA
nr:hypothetical protein [Tanacetum cinerariifolium]